MGQERGQVPANDAWAGRGNESYPVPNAAELRRAPSSCWPRNEVSDRLLLRSLRHFYRYAGRGNNPYGDNRPEVGFVDNGKNGKLAFAMAAAAALTPDGENSLYARARDAPSRASTPPVSCCTGTPEVVSARSGGAQPWA